MIEMSFRAGCFSTARIQSQFSLLILSRHCFGNPMSNVHPRHTYPIHKLAFASNHLCSVLDGATAALLVQSEN
jgi:hypothetical protein